MSVFIPIPISEIHLDRSPPSKSYKIDWERGRILPAGSIDGIDAVQQAIKKILLTVRFRCLIYDNQYGSEQRDVVIRYDATPEIVRSELPRLVRDALSADDRITEVRNFQSDFEGEKLFIAFDADTVYGEIHYRDEV